MIAGWWMVAGGMDKEDCVSIESLGIFFGSSGAISTDETLLVDKFGWLWIEWNNWSYNRLQCVL